VNQGLGKVSWPPKIWSWGQYLHTALLCCVLTSAFFICIYRSLPLYIALTVSTISRGGAKSNVSCYTIKLEREHQPYSALKEQRQIWPIPNAHYKRQNRTAGTVDSTNGHNLQCINFTETATASELKRLTDNTCFSMAIKPMRDCRQLILSPHASYVHEHESPSASSFHNSVDHLLRYTRPVTVITQPDAGEQLVCNSQNHPITSSWYANVS